MLLYLVTVWWWILTCKKWWSITDLGYWSSCATTLRNNSTLSGEHGWHLLNLIERFGNLSKLGFEATSELTVGVLQKVREEHGVFQGAYQPKPQLSRRKFRARPQKYPNLGRVNAPSSTQVASNQPIKPCAPLETWKVVLFAPLITHGWSIESAGSSKPGDFRVVWSPAGIWRVRGSVIGRPPCSHYF